MNRNRLAELLTHYIDALEAGRASCRRPEERNLYTERLAEAGRIAKVLLTPKETDRERLIELVESERHSIGWSYFEGAAGARVDETFSALDSAIPKRESAA